MRRVAYWIFLRRNITPAEMAAFVAFGVAVAGEGYWLPPLVLAFLAGLLPSIWKAKAGE